MHQDVFKREDLWPTRDIGLSSLNTYMRLDRDVYESDFLVLVDNARPHKANLIDLYLKVKLLSEYRGQKNLLIWTR